MKKRIISTCLIIMILFAGSLTFADNTDPNEPADTGYDPSYVARLNEEISRLQKQIDSLVDEYDDLNGLILGNLSQHATYAIAFAQATDDASRIYYNHQMALLTIERTLWREEQAQIKDEITRLTTKSNELVREREAYKDKYGM